MMKTLLVAMIALLALAAGPISVDSSANDVLDALDARGKDLKSLSADVKMTDIDPTIGEAGDVRTGHLSYELLPSGDSRWHALFDKKITGNRIVDQKHEWSYANGTLIERDYRNQTQITRQILKPGEKMQLFNLEGPFPLPLGQDKADVHKHFEVQKLPLAKDDPPATVHLQLAPIEGTDLARKFKTIDLWVDPKTDMPVRISVLDADGNSEKQTDLTNPQPNGAVKDGDFELEKVNLANWNQKDE
jgi:outer membrane lipoprotein-sorting protein